VPWGQYKNIYTVVHYFSVFIITGLQLMSSHTIVHDHLQISVQNKILLVTLNNAVN